MKRKEAGVLVAGILALGLAACSSSPVTEDTASTSPGASSEIYPGPLTGSTATGGSGSTGSTGNTGSTNATASSSANPGATTEAGSTAQDKPMDTASPPPTARANSRVVSIESVPRAGVTLQPGGSTGSSGTTGSTASSGNVWRITLQMDDGTTRVLTQEWAPTFRTGDRIEYAGGAIQR